MARATHTHHQLLNTPGVADDNVIICCVVGLILSHNLSVATILCLYDGWPIVSIDCQHEVLYYMQLMAYFIIVAFHHIWHFSGDFAEANHSLMFCAFFFFFSSLCLQNKVYHDSMVRYKNAYLVVTVRSILISVSEYFHFCTFC